MKGIADTGFLVAFVSRDDAYHDWAVGLAGELTEPLLTCEAVLAETAYNLRNSSVIFEMLNDGIITLAFDCNDHLPQLEYLAERPLAMIQAVFRHYGREHEIEAFMPMLQPWITQIRALPTHHPVYGIIHGDPHSGNYRVTEDDRITLFEVVSPNTTAAVTDRLQVSEKVAG